MMIHFLTSVRKSRFSEVLGIQKCIYVIMLIIIVTDLICNMKKFRKYSYFEDLKRIKSGYMPKRYYKTLYNMDVIFYVLKAIFISNGEKFIAGLFNYGKLHIFCYKDDFNVILEFISRYMPKVSEIFKVFYYKTTHIVILIKKEGKIE
jgi:hypothetical protein